MMALQVAMDNISYTEFEVGAEAQQRELVYNWLAANQGLRDSIPVLDSFYLAQHATEIRLIQDADKALALLTDSTTISNPSIWQLKLIEAKIANNNLSNNTVFSTNAKWINEIKLQQLQFGLDSITTLQWMQIENLANSCPYFDGDAVYKAREIIAFKKPANYYNDLRICNTQGYYKTSHQSSLELQLKQLNAIANNNFNKGIKAELEEAFLYPNPTNNCININYKLKQYETAQLLIYDVLGVQLENFVINSQNELIGLNVSDLRNGVYTYKFITSVGNNYCGKFIFE
jgi:hypothetical protein